MAQRASPCHAGWLGPLPLSSTDQGEPRPTRKLPTPRFPEAPVGPAPALSQVFVCPPAPVRQVTVALGLWSERHGHTAAPRAPPPSLPQGTESGFSVPVSPSVCSTVSKQRKNVISCVTVHDSPYSDSSSNTSPYSVQHRAGHNASTFDTKGSLENHCTGNPRTIIVPPLKTQASEVLVECDSLVPGNLGPAGGWVSVFCHEQFCDVSAGRCGAAVGFCSASLMSSIFGV